MKPPVFSNNITVEKKGGVVHRSKKRRGKSEVYSANAYRR